jgi:hypothetical protein
MATYQHVDLTTLAAGLLLLLIYKQLKDLRLSSLATLVRLIIFPKILQLALETLTNVFTTKFNQHEDLNNVENCFIFQFQFVFISLMCSYQCLTYF